VVKQVADHLPAVPASTDETLRKTTAAAQPAVDAAVDTTSTAAQVARGRAGDSGGLRVGASSLRRASSARLRHPRRAESGAPPAASPVKRLAPPGTGTASHAVPAGHRVAAQSTSARPEPGRHPAVHQGAGADGGISAGFGFAGGLAVLAAALLLVAPQLRRRLSIDPAVLRPVAFVALLERPG
jgi:hypothetical protein